MLSLLGTGSVAVIALNRGEHLNVLWSFESGSNDM